jgi:hypothetical protein
MAPNIDQLLSSPNHYLHSFEGEDAVFVQMDRAAYRRSIFLDRRISCAANGSVRVPVADLIAPAPLATDWIFHVAHCGSTLLARALDEMSDNLVLREPLALRQLALTPDAARLKQTLALLSRRYADGGPTLIKANVPVNFLLEDIALADTQARAIFLYCNLPDYLLAILRSDNHRAWLRNVTGQLAHKLGDLSSLSDAELGAALWIAQLSRFAKAIEQMPSARSLNAEVFFAEPAEILGAAARFFGKNDDPQSIGTLVSGPLFNTYSKNPTHAFDNDARLARRDRLVDQLSDEIAQAERYISGVAPDAETLITAITSAALITG